MPNPSNGDPHRIRSGSRLKRKPFSDLTNSSSSPLNPVPIPKPRSVPESIPVPDSQHKADPEPASSSTAAGQENDGDLASSASTPKSKDPATNRGRDADNNDKLDNSTVSPRLIKTRRKGKEKVVEVAQTLSCPPLGRKGSIVHSRLKDRVDELQKALSVPCTKTRKRKERLETHLKPKIPILPRGVVEKFRTYFAEIDAFELPEEEVSDED